MVEVAWTTVDVGAGLMDPMGKSCSPVYHPSMAVVGESKFHIVMAGKTSSMIEGRVFKGLFVVLSVVWS